MLCMKTGASWAPRKISCNTVCRVGHKTRIVGFFKPSLGPGAVRSVPSPTCIEVPNYPISIRLVKSGFPFFAWKIDRYPLTQGSCHREHSWSPMIFQWLFCIQNQNFLSTCAACLEVVFAFEWRTTYFNKGQTYFRTFLVCEFYSPWTNIECSSFKPPHHL